MGFFLGRKRTAWIFLKQAKNKHRKESWSYSSFHIRKTYILDSHLFLDAHKVKFNTAAKTILRPKRPKWQFHDVFIQETLNRKKPKTVQDSLENFNTNNKLQAEKIIKNSFAKDLLQSCRGCWLAVFAVVLQDEQSLWFYPVDRTATLATEHSIHMHSLQHPYPWPQPHCSCHIYLWLGVEKLSHCWFLCILGEVWRKETRNIF